MNSVEVKAQAFEWEIEFPDGVIWTVVETGIILAVESRELGDLGFKGMDTLTFLRRAVSFGGGTILSVHDIGPM